MNVRLCINSWFLGAVLAFSAGLGCHAQDPDNPLVGRWLLQRKGALDARPYKVEWQFTKDRVIVRIVRDPANSEEVSRNNYTIDTTKDPKWITVTVVDKVTEVRQGIFRIVGDELHLKQTVGGGARPVDFEKENYSVMKRQPQGNGQPSGPANRSQPLRPGTNRTSAAAGSGR
jgi:uncharacterized protein (TIGR03067 family)